ncbi:uncharacterized protein [Antedon mediterranea]|uniref:uncharacterized protein isoform X2 n=1 Tax=Antedon mediterranea TaxID=105859 RepID=UPI003AF76908
MKYYALLVLCVCEIIHLVAAQTESGSCVKIPANPENGVIYYTPENPNNLPNLMNGTRADYVCSDGYTNDGFQLVIYCYNGEWLGLDNDEPTMCVKHSTGINSRDCESPEGNSRRNYLIQTGSHRHGGHINYACVPGYVLHPKDRTSNCINGGWTNPAPHCVDPSIRTSPKPDDKEDDPSSGSSSTGAIAGTVVAVVLILIVAILIYRFRFYQPRDSQNLRGNEAPWNAVAFEPAAQRVIDDVEFPYSSPNIVLQNTNVTFIDPVEDVANTYTVTIAHEGSRRQTVIAHVIHGSYTEEEKQAMEREMDTVFKLPVHYGVIRPIAQIKDADMIGICTEKSPKGTLRSYLHSFRDARNSVKPKARELINYAIQIAEAMQFLHEEERVCPMLRCQLVMLFRDNVVKIPVLGLKHISDNTDLYRFGGETSLPLRWMSPEAIAYHITTKKCDVWTFGIVLYEIVTLGDIPYDGIDEENLPELLSNGHRLAKPQCCSNALFSLMESCWQTDPKDRPSFGDLVSYLRVLKDDNNAICFGPDYIEHPASGNPFLRF